MKIHLVTIGKPKLSYAKLGWEEYLTRLRHLHTVRLTQLADKYAYNIDKLADATVGTFVVVLDIQGAQLSSPELATFLQKHELGAREISFVIGGPEGLPPAVRDAADYRWGLGKLTLPHDLAMITTIEALYRASTINSGHPYHK